MEVISYADDVRSQKPNTWTCWMMRQQGDKQQQEATTTLWLERPREKGLFWKAESWWELHIRSLKS